MKMLRQTPKLAIPVRPSFAAIEARLSELRKRDNALTNLIIEAEQTSGGTPALSDDATKIETEARALVRAEMAAADKPAPIKVQNLKQLLHERAVIRRALEIAGDTLADLRAAWAAQVFTEYSGVYRESVRKTALAVAAARKAERERQAILAGFGWSLGRPGLPCAAFGLAAGLGENSVGPIHLFMQAAIKAGIVTKEELADV
jgi:hypothetical protein